MTDPAVNNCKLPVLNITCLNDEDNILGRLAINARLTDLSILSPGVNMRWP